MIKESKKTVFTTANILTLLRILLIPVFMALMLKHKITLAFVVFLIAVSTDLFDGIAARVWKQKTKLGTFLDPAADKLLMASTFIFLSLPSVSTPNTIPIWLVVVVVIRDIYIVSGALTYIRLTNATEAKPSFMGKICTVVEMSLLTLVLLFNSLGKAPAFLAPGYFLTMVIAILSAAHYTVIGIRGLQQYKRTQQKKT
ncbi:CDP-alcohol phosphatidyltransferase family protein [Acidobacteriota bacterium]